MPNQDAESQGQQDESQGRAAESQGRRSGSRSWRSESLGETGDPGAEPGTREWALHVAHRIRSAVSDAESDVRRLKGWIKDFREQKGHRAMGYNSWPSFCEDWLGREAGQIRAMVSARQAARALADQYDGSELSGQGRPEKGSDDNAFGGGRGAGYYAARIARDHPQVHERMKRGEYRSVRQAAIEAGIIEDRTRVSFYADDPGRACRNIFKHMTRADIQRLRDLLARRLENEGEP